MKYSKVYVDAIGYELPPVVVTSTELEEQLEPLYTSLHIQPGQLESLTGIAERRWWEKDYPLWKGAHLAACKALRGSGVNPENIGAVVYAGVNRENFEPATACRIAAELGVGSDTAIYDISNACLGVLNAMIEIANRIELSQIRAGLIVSCETARAINDTMIARMLEDPSMENFAKSLATLTGGSGAAAVLLTDGSFAKENGHRLLGGIAHAAPEHYGLCSWGLRPEPGNMLREIMTTDASSVLKFGVELGKRTWQAFLQELNWDRERVDKVITHQVGSANRDSILKGLGISEEKEFGTYPFLGNMGTVSLPITAALAEERGFLQRGDRVGFLGIGSGLNCLMLGLEW